MSRRSKPKDAQYCGCLARSIHVWLAICARCRLGTGVNGRSLKSAKCFGLSVSPCPKSKAPCVLGDALMSLKFISLFSGIGGIDLGFERAGMKCVAQVEIDDFCRSVLDKHWPDTPKFKDVRDVGKHNLPTADVICGGFPCQPFSIAGKRRGTEDDRNLWPEMLRIVREIRPHWVVGENVTHFTKLALDGVISDLEAIGYTATAFDISSAAVGLPTMERHVWIIAAPNSIRPQGSIGKAIQDITALSWEFQRSYQRIPERWSVSTARVCGVGERIPNRVDRLRSLGNAVPPRMAEVVGRAILCVEEHMKF